MRTRTHYGTQADSKNFSAILRLVLALTLSASVSAGLRAQTSSSTADGENALGIALESYPYPYPVHFLEFEMQHQMVRMAYMDISPTGSPNGQTVVLLHGKNFGGYYWEKPIHFLATAGYRVVVPDQVGWGKSSKPDVRYSFADLAANTVRLLDSLGINRVILVGHSTGGMLAVRFARTYPQLVAALVLEDPVGLEDYRVSIPPQTDETLYRAELNNTKRENIDAFYARYFAHPDPAVYGGLADVQFRITKSGEFPRWAKASALAYQMIYEQPVLYEYRLLRPPTLLIVGKEDHTVPMSAYASADVRPTLGHIVELAQKVIKEVPDGTLAIVPDAGHIPHIEQPNVFQGNLMEFLRKHPVQ
jgi:pimeloyl-ACP methyl ester carboxylesterase